MFTTGKIYTGWSEIDITPERAVPLFGQYYERLSKYVQSNLTATALALESIAVDGAKEQAIMISIDLLWCTAEIQCCVRKQVADRLEGFDANKLLIFATHTHSGPEPDAKSEYGTMLIDKLTEAAVTAWHNRTASGGLQSCLTYVPVGHNRRVQYADGSTEMYGEVNREDYIGIEGPGDSSMDLLFCRDSKGDLEGIIVNIPCPAQVTEAKDYISADYWHEVRKVLRERFSKALYVLAQCGAAGDLSPRDLTRGYKADEPNMWEAEGTVALGKRIGDVIFEAYSNLGKREREAIVFKHIVCTLDIPLRSISPEAYAESLSIVREIKSREPEDKNSPGTAWNRFLAEIKSNEKVKRHGPWDNKKSDYAILRKKELEVEQYKIHPIQKIYKAEIHVLRLGDIVFATNPFELFVDYGFMIKGRGASKQIFVVQLCGDYADYLPTKRALAGGGYSAMATMVGDDGGKVLVNNTVRIINELFR
ncbi:hypothetical protein FW774_04195 (plasmid) [Pedobacter sp. BS3]|uniref:hypothetical protein n=1 Tax=Pedobacter sp. BS3 TaxID=2567937 RepID=UPI0011EC329B|nr:hypothetical protein [Pedobacter sp. BS3]TZF86255.1 hypothetical protein FW774_04195 [Pedobacter sp. BS3]